MGFTYGEEAFLMENWQRMAQKYKGHGTTVSNDTSDPRSGRETDGDVRVYKMSLPHSSGRIHLRVSDIKHLTLEYRFPTELPFEFSIVAEGITDKVFKLFGAQDVELSIGDFDRKYLLNSNQPRLLQKMFDGPMVKYMVNNSVTSLSLVPVDGESILRIFMYQKLVLDEDAMDQLILFFKTTVDNIPV